ncbi:unnamed protein product, partial [Meganyctiphanes norvegica]
MGNGMNKVLPGLYVGNFRDSKDSDQLRQHNITHILSIHDNPRRLPCNSDKEYLCIMASDSPGQNLTQFFPTCNDFIHNARLKNGAVLVHCLAGMSRSVTVAVVYVMSVTSMNWRDALKAVRGARSVANPNVGFLRQLQDFENERLTEERRRLLEKYPSKCLQEDDEAMAKTLLASYEHSMRLGEMCEGNCGAGVTCPRGLCHPARRGTGLLRKNSRERSSSPVRHGGGSSSSSSASPSPVPPRRSSPTPPSPLTRRSTSKNSSRTSSINSSPQVTPQHNSPQHTGRSASSPHSSPHSSPKRSVSPNTSPKHTYAYAYLKHSYTSPPGSGSSSPTSSPKHTAIYMPSVSSKSSAKRGSSPKDSPKHPLAKTSRQSRSLSPKTSSPKFTTPKIILPKTILSKSSKKDKSNQPSNVIHQSVRFSSDYQRSISLDSQGFQEATEIQNLNKPLNVNINYHNKTTGATASKRSTFADSTLQMLKSIMKENVNVVIEIPLRGDSKKRTSPTKSNVQKDMAQTYPSPILRRDSSKKINNNQDQIRNFSKASYVDQDMDQDLLAKSVSTKNKSSKEVDSHPIARWDSSPKLAHIKDFHPLQSDHHPEHFQGLSKWGSSGILHKEDEVSMHPKTQAHFGSLSQLTRRSSGSNLLQKKE